MGEKLDENSNIFTAPACDGYRGIWYWCNGMPEPWKYKYSGGLGTYCAKHIPMAVHAADVGRTFFCYGGAADDDAGRLVHMVGVFDHATGKVCRPRVVVDKRTGDAHDNPVIAVGRDGHVWIFSSAHGTQREAFIHRSVEPYDIARWERVSRPGLNFSYAQPWPRDDGGFLFLHTRYRRDEAGLHRELFWQNSADGRNWDEGKLLAGVRNGHYQVSWRRGRLVGTAFNMHPGTVDRRTNLYYLATEDEGRTWRTAGGQAVKVPLKEVQNEALAVDFEAKGRLVYLKDLNFDEQGRPVVLIVVATGATPGPAGAPRWWEVVKWDGMAWQRAVVCMADANYDTGCIHVHGGGNWRIIAPTGVGPQPGGAGGEMAVWESTDEGHTWQEQRKMTANSAYNHTYARRPVAAADGFYALWADGDARRPSPSRLYLANRTGDVWRLPERMDGQWALPVPVKPRADER